MARTPIINDPENPVLTQLQAKAVPGCRGMRVGMDKATQADLSSLEEFFQTTCGMNPSSTVIVRRALTLYAESLERDVHKAQDLDGLQRIIKRERAGLVKAAGRSRGDQEHHHTYDRIRGRKGQVK